METGQLFHHVPTTEGQNAMLVLKRKRYQSIHIGNGITITLLEAHNNIANIGIEAPRQIPIHRSEVADRIAAGAPLTTAHSQANGAGR